jgi:hypothetical protein
MDERLCLVYARNRLSPTDRASVSNGRAPSLPVDSTTVRQQVLFMRCFAPSGELHSTAPY